MRSDSHTITVVGWVGVGTSTPPTGTVSMWVDGCVPTNSPHVQEPTHPGAHITTGHRTSHDQRVRPTLLPCLGCLLP